ncbi:peroxiredoxin [Paraglaciecola chathamensis]|jgi:peroxiredoxin|uniref:Glutathione-dependent peroxiredoxin n=1 Tax=Paraglaciecola chathamensis TaxID=368405 RepID=A0A8H9M534_9ALTE|nr:peroxiredoxin [Paraglaciecola oceanifecundans]GGZ75432.1 peroxiredoxin [Paraglaciecola oceanifecundans]
MIKVGDTLPQVTFSLRENDESSNPTTADLFADKKVVLFAVPGAFTPTCSNAHLPGYISLADKLEAQGVERIICLSVNDAFVMQAWGQSQNAEHITMLADGGAEFTQAIGMAKDTGTFGGVRSGRYSMLVENGVVKLLNVEAPGKFDVSDAQTMLDSL